VSQLVLIGAGGHARMIVDILLANKKRVDVVIDPVKPSWLEAEHRFDDELIAPDSLVVMGFGGVTPQRLQARLTILLRALARGCTAPQIRHPSAVVSPSARIGRGVQIAAGAIVQASATLEDGVIVNTGAIIEHDVLVGAGTHVAPGAIILGAAVIGTNCMIGAGAVVLPETRVGDRMLVAALTRTA
jgi:sugar O-acyltransferase (sialic acid O-acetyltransferase NeuD family)